MTPTFVSINATSEVEFRGQAASETVAGRYWSGSVARLISDTSGSRGTMTDAARTVSRSRAAL